MKMMLCCLYVLYSVSSVFASDYEPYVYRQDFETRELMAWSSYPPVQDAAYEAPYIYPGTIVPGEEGTVLCKIIYPQWNVPQLTGIVKRLNIRLDNESHISFRYYIKTSLEPSWIGIDLPMLDGDRIRSRFMKPLTNKWVTVDFGLKEIFDAAGRIKTDHLDITAFAITVRFEHADPDMPIAIGFDDFLVSGQREATFRYEQPRTVSLEEWDSDIAMKHYRYGDELIIKGMFPYSNPVIITAQIVRFDRPEHTIRTVPMKKDGGSWVTIKSVKIDAKTFPAGMYEVRLTGTKKNEPVARSSFSFMVLDDAMYSEHPRFWFNSQNKHDFITRLKSDKYKPFLEKIRLEAQDARERLSVNLPYDLDTFPTKGWLSSFEPYRTRIATIPQRALTNAIVYTVDGDSEAGEWAKKAMVSLCQWPSWNHPWMRNRGHHIYLYQYYTTYNLALTYDILYDLLTETEREIVRKAMIRNGLKPAYRTYVVADMCTCNESNWITAIAGGAIAGACAILGETDNTDQFEPYLSGCLYKIKAHMNTVYGGDSSCLEGFGYGYGTMWIYSEVLPFLKNSLNIDMSPWLDRQYTEGFWAADHNAGMYFTFGDARISLPDMAFCPWLIDKFRDPELAWFYDLNPPAPAFTSYHTVLFDIDNIPRKPPENLTGAKWFKSTGTVVFRSGPGPEPFVLTFRCGPFGNHQHIDQGTFFLADRGELFITEQEYSDYYEDPIYQSHIIQPVGHNCILINHNPQSQRTGDHEKYATGMSDFARITDFVSDESMAFALGDLSPVYLGNVKKLQRGILYLHPRTAIIIDRFETKSGEATMDVLFHGPKYSDIRDLDGKFEISSGKTSLYGFPMGISSPSKYTITPDPVKLANYTDDPVEPMGRVTVTTGTTGGKAVSALLFGEQKTVDSGDGSAFFTPDDTYVVINGSETELYDYGICTDGLCVVMTKNGSLLLVDGTYLRIDGFTLMKADKPVTILVEGKNINYSTAKPATVEILSDTSIRKIMDDNGVEKWKVNDRSRLITLNISEGQGRVRLKK